MTDNPFDALIQLEARRTARRRMPPGGAAVLCLIAGGILWAVGIWAVIA